MRMLEIEGIGIELVWLIAIGILSLIALIAAWKTSNRSPLDYDVYMVETQTNPNDGRRALQVMHIGYEERRLAGSELMRRMAQGRVFPRVDDLSVVIQSPSTIIESNTQREPPPDTQLNTVRVWAMEMTGAIDSPSHTGMAAAFAIAVANGRHELSLGGGRTVTLVNMDTNGQETQEISNEEAIEVDGRTGTPSDTHPVDEEDTVDDVDENGDERSEGEGTSQIDEGEKIKIRLKFLDDTIREAEIGINASIGDLKARHLNDMIEGGSSVRLIFRGQLLRNDSQSLSSVGMHDECVVHVLIGGIRREERREETVADTNNVQPQRTIMEDPLAAQVEAGMGSAREAVNTAALVLLTLVDHLGQTWLGVARIMRDTLTRRIVQAGERGDRLGWMDSLCIWLARQFGILPSADAPLPHTSTLSFLFPIILTLQIGVAWTFVAAFPRFFDYVSVVFLFIISLLFVLFCTRRQGMDEIVPRTQ